jgi:hypothetical protein
MSVNQNFPATVEMAAKQGMALLDEHGRREVAKIGIFNPHMKYDTDFLSVIGGGLGIVDGGNLRLVRDIIENHADKMHFLEIQEGAVDVNTVMRIVMAAISQEAQRTAE